MTLHDETNSESPENLGEPMTARAEARGSLDLSPGSPTHLVKLFLVLAGGLMIGTILHQRDPVQGPNDGSRWDTVYYLVEHGTYEFLPNHGAWWGHPKPERPRDIPPFGTIDMIAYRDSKGAYHYYSSKPPFLPTVLAGLVLAIEKLSFGRADFAQHPWFFTRITLILVQVLPLLVAFRLICRHVLRNHAPSFVHIFCLAAITLSTYLTAWTSTLNNHVIAAATGVFALHAFIRIWYDGRREWYWFAIAGFFAAFTAATELPAGLLAVTMLVLMLSKDWRRTVIAGVSAAVIPTAIAIATNVIVTGRVLPAYTEVFKPGGVYDFPGSYWSQCAGIDALNEPKSVYVLNMLVGHHGFFSLTPVLILCLVGLIRNLSRREGNRPLLAGLTLFLTTVVAAVYAYKTNNYGGMCEGFRWLFWLVPLWLLFLSDGVQPLSRAATGRFACLLALAISMISMADALPRPWSYGWLQRLAHQLNWIGY